MAGPGGAEVGRVSIRVVPDFTYFRKIMRAVLKEFDGKEITVKVKADAAALNGLSKDLNKAARQSSRDMSRELSKGIKRASKGATIAPMLDHKTRYRNRIESDINKLFSDIEVRLKYDTGDNTALRKAFDADEKHIRAVVAKINSEMGNLDFELTARQADRLLESSKRLAKEKLVSPSAKLDYKLMEQAAKSYDDAADAARRHNQVMREWQLEHSKAIGTVRNLDDALNKMFDTSIQKNIAARIAFREYLYGFKNLEGETLRTATTADRFRLRGGLIGVLLGGASALGALDAAKEGIQGIGHAVGKVSGSFKGFNPRDIGLSISGGAFAVAAIGILMAAAPLIGLISAALLTLPGIISLITAPIGAVVLGFKGIQKAAENAGLFGDKNGDKRGGGALGKALTDLQDKANATFEAILTDPFKRLGDAAQQWVNPLAKVAEGTANVMKDILSSFTEGAGPQKIAETFDAIGASLTNSFGPGLKSFTDAMLDLAHEFTTGGALAGVGEWFRNTMDDFSRWVSEGIKTGELKETFRQLGDSLRIVLELVGDLAQKGLDFVSDPAKMDAFKNTLKEIADLLGKVMTLSRELAPLWTALAAALGAVADPFDNLSKVINEPGSLKNWDDLARSLIPDGATGIKIAEGWFNKDAMNQAAVEAGNSAAEQFSLTTAAVMAANKETQKAMLREAFTGEGITTAVQTQMTQQAQIAITGVQQAIVPLKEGLQNDINAALQPLGDIAGKVEAAFGSVPGLVQGSLGQIPGIVRTAMGNLGAEAETSMAGVSDAVIKHCAIAVNTANSEAPRIKAPFEALKDGMVAVGNQMMAGLAAGISNSVGFAEAAAGAAARRVKAAADAAAGIKSPSREFMKTGDYMMQGMQLGIENGTAGPIAAMREVMQAIKDVFGSAEGLNINFFMGQAASSMSAMADSSKEFRSNMVEAATTPALSSGLDTDPDDIKRQKAAIDLQIAQLQAQKNATQDKAAKAALTAEMDQLRIQKERLDLLKEESGLQEERRTAIQKLSDTIATNIVDMIKMPGEFARATTNAAMQDIGISGQGAIPTIANWALDAGTNFIFNVNNMDDAIQGQQAQQRKQTAGIAGR